MRAMWQGAGKSCRRSWLAPFALLFLALNEVAQARDLPSLPAPGVSWDWQLSRPLNLFAKVRVMDLDPDLISPRQARRLGARNVYLICYVSVGTWENWRADGKRFPRRLLGRSLAEWPDERFLDIRRVEILLPIMRARFARCKRLGFQAVEADNLDLHDQRTGFALRAEDVVRYARALAELAHGMGLAIAQKNVPELTVELSSFMDFAVVEECFTQGWCGQMRPYLDRNRPVLAAEYRHHQPHARRACAQAKRLGISLIFKRRALDAWRRDCADVLTGGHR